MKIDAYAHALPPGYSPAVQQALGRPVALWEKCPTLSSLDLRLSMLDEFGVDMQVVSLPPPPLESMFAGARSTELARLANDGMAELVSRCPDRLRGIAAVCLLDPDQAAAEVQRSVRALGLSGVQIYSNVAGRPLDGPALDVFYATVAALDVPIWLHPHRSEARPDYAGEEQSRYSLGRVFGWTYDTTLAMGRLVFGGVMQRHPRLKVIVHHAGAMVPFMAGRIEQQYGPGSGGGPDAADAGERPGQQPGVNDFRRFYVDTITAGSLPALMNAYTFFGPERLVFASDMPLGKEIGRDYLRDAVATVSQMPIPGAEKAQIWSGTLQRLCGWDRGNPAPVAAREEDP